MYSTQHVFIKDKIFFTNALFDELFNDKHYVMMEHVDHIVLSYPFNQIIDIPPHILSVQFPDKYNKPIILTPNLVSLVFENYYGKCLELGPCMKRLIIGSVKNNYFVKCHVILNKYLVHLEILGSVHLNFISSKYLEELTIGYNMQIISNCYIRKIIMLGNFNLTIELPKKVKILKTSNYFNQMLRLNKNIRTLRLGCNFDQNIVLPKHSENICFVSNHVRPIILPPYIKNLHVEHVTFGNISIEHSNVNTLFWISGYRFSSKQDVNIFEFLPHGVKHIKTNFEAKRFLNNLPITSHVTKIMNYNIWDQMIREIF